MSWAVIRLGDVSERIDYGLTASAVDKLEGPRFLRITDMQDDTVKWDAVPSCECSSHEYEDNKLAVGDIVFARTGATTGKSYLLRDLPEPAVFASYLIRVRPSQNVDPVYLSYFFKSSTYWHQITSMAEGAAQPGVNASKLKMLEVPLPPLPEQKRIAAILDKADAIRRKRQQAIQLTDDFLCAVFLDMFGDPVTNPKGWPALRIDNLCTIVRGSSPRPQGDSRFYGGPVPRLMVADLTRDGKLVTPMIDSLTEEGAKKSRPIEAGTVVMAVSGNVGLTSVLAIDACIHDGFIAFKELDANKIRPEFLCELMMFLKSTHASRQAGAIFQNLTTSQIKEMKIPIPTSALQDKFLSINRKATELYGEDGSLLFESVSQKAFSGQL